MQMCHKHGVMHRDLKPENFLFGNKKETAPLKAIDFGLSVFFKPGIRLDPLSMTAFHLSFTYLFSCNTHFFFFVNLCKCNIII